MIDPVLFSFKLFGNTIDLTWYGLIVMSGVLLGAWLAEKEVRRRGENGEVLVDAMVWAVIGGILGARFWYVANATLGGNHSYIDDPLSIIRPPIAGLHFFGGLLFGGLTLIIYLRQNGYDAWLFLDAVAPVTLIGQALGRLGNFINQELYGQPTLLPWGISIAANHRIQQYADLIKFPVETTRFHPTFAYEMILNTLAFLFMLWYARRYQNRIKAGELFSLWLIFAGFMRTFIEFFRPDQPRIGDTFISYTMAISFLMGVSGVILYLARIGVTKPAFAASWPAGYRVKSIKKPAPATAVKRPAPVEKASPVVEKTVVSTTPVVEKPVAASARKPSLEVEQAAPAPVEVKEPALATIESKTEEVIPPVEVKKRVSTPRAKKPAAKTTVAKPAAKKSVGTVKKTTAAKKPAAKPVTTAKKPTAKKPASGAAKKTVSTKKPAPKKTSTTSKKTK
ncbi:MAG TPA: prolipoprotein diacylglyceryl transferase [Anaerolineales bacterium]|nr:prolipoprotein diacylglyceryl transferase [Anaerolineales bacterium]